MSGISDELMNWSSMAVAEGDSGRLSSLRVSQAAQVMQAIVKT